MPLNHHAHLNGTIEPDGPQGGVFSDYLYKPFLCATAEIDGRWTCERNIERRDAADLSVKEFVEKYERGAGVPLIITGLASRWPAVRGGKASRNDDRNVSGTEQKERSTTSDSSNAGHGERESGAPSLGKAWTEANLLDAAGDARLLCGGFPYRLSDFFAYQRQVAAAAEGEGGEEGEGEGRKQVGSVGSGGEPDDQTLYLFDHRFQDKVPALRGGAGRDWSCPRYFAGGDRDLFSLLGDERPRHSWIIAGCKRSGSNWHQDPNATSAWNAVIRGAKKWILLPPDVIPPGVHPSEDHATVATPLSPMEWFLDFYPALGSLPRRQRDRCVEAVCREGEIMFIPSGWWHTVLNLEDSLAITQNYVSPSNLEACLRFLLLRNTQVSGYDRDEDKRSLHRRFVAALRRDRPSLLEACSGVARGEKGVAESKRGEGEEKGGEGREKKGKVAGLGAIFSQERKKRKENRKKRAKKTTKKKGTGEIDTEEEGDDDDEGAQGGGFSFSFSF